MNPKPPIELRVENPEPGGKGFFALTLEMCDDPSPESWAAIKEAIEFRRRCMNQGFDNLLELIEMTRKTMMRKFPPKGVCETDTLAADPMNKAVL